MEGALIATCGITAVSLACSLIAIARFPLPTGTMRLLNPTRFFLLSGVGAVLGGGLAAGLAILDHSQGFSKIERPKISLWERAFIDAIAIAVPPLYAGSLAVLLCAIAYTLREIRLGNPFRPFPGYSFRDWETLLKGYQDYTSLFTGVFPAFAIPTVLVRFLPGPEINAAA